MGETSGRSPHVVEVTENDSANVLRMSRDQAVAMQALNFCRLTPVGSDDEWRLSHFTRVGVASVPGLTVLIRPKTPLRSLVFMVSYAGEQIELADGSFAFEDQHSLPVALAAALKEAVERLTVHGLLKGYREVEESANLVRGRWNVARQLRTRAGIPLPVETDHDDFTADIAENRVLRSALSAAVRFPSISPTLRSALSALLQAFDGVAGWRGPVQLPPETRLNRHYRPALRIAEWILEAVSWTHEHGARDGRSFLVRTDLVFERFVGECLKRWAVSRGLSVQLQDTRWRFDTAEEVSMRPDIVVRRREQVVTVADTKYRVWGEQAREGRGETPQKRRVGAPPNSDLYQALAYGTVAGVKDVHLVYVSGEVEPRRYEVHNAEITVTAHALDLGGEPSELVSSVDRLAVALMGHELKPVACAVGDSIW